MGVFQGGGPLRLKGLFAFGVVVLSLGYVVPTVGVAAGPGARLQPRAVAPPDAPLSTFKPLLLIQRQDARVYDGRQVRFAENLRTVVDAIPNAVHQVPDASLPVGQTVVEVPGVPGTLTRVFEDDLVDGDVVETTQLSEVLTTAVDALLRVGTAASPVPAAPAVSLSGAPPGYTRAIAGQATAYCLTGTTATGTQAGPGAIAVDPGVIPLGSHLYVPGYGYGQAVDTGGLIKGNIVDLWMTCPAAIQWGRRNLTIYVVP